MFTGGLDQPEMWKCFFKKNKKKQEKLLSGFETIGKKITTLWEYSK